MAFEEEASAVLKKGEEWLQAGHFTEAENAFSHLLDRNPRNAELWYYLGTCAIARNQWTKALLLLNQSVTLAPEMITAWNNMGVAHKALLHTDDALRCFEKALSLYPQETQYTKEKAQTLSSLGGMWSNSGHPERGLAHCEEAYRISPEDQQIRFNLGLLYLELGRWAEGFPLYSNRDSKDKDYQGGLPVWDGTPGKRVVIYGEQGIGDELMFASIIPDAVRDCAQVVVDAHPRLQNFLQRSFKEYGIPIYGTRKVLHPKWEQHVKLDARIGMGQLAALYRKRDEDFPRVPYLFADPLLVAEYRERLAHYPKPRIAIAWRGGYQKTHKDKRSMPAKMLADALSGIGTIWSMQYTREAPTDAAACGILHWQDEIDDYELTAAMVMNMDLVVTVNQSLAHLCGALGKECWVLTPKACAFRYGLKGPRMPFYGDWITQYRQGEDERWEPVLERVREDAWRRFRKSIAA